MKYKYLLFLFYIISSTAYAANNDWVGEWKINDKNKYMSLEIKSKAKAEPGFFYDEGIGINGISFDGTVKISQKNIAFVDYFYRGKQCKLKLQLLISDKNKTLALSGCELDSYDEEPEAIKYFVPKAQKLYYKAGFNCAKSSTKIEVAICDSKVLAAADKRLGSLYKILRKRLSGKNKKRLKTEQRRWMKKRNSQCKQQSNNELNYCLRRHYGKRLLALNILKDYNVWQTGQLGYSTFYDVNVAQKKQKIKLYFNPLDSGLGLWLGGVMKRHLTDTGSYEIQTDEFDNNSYILSGPYSANPSEGFDPMASGNSIFMALSSTTGVWVGLVAYSDNFIYIPKDKTISDAPAKLKLWMKDFEEPKIVNVF